MSIFLPAQDPAISKRRWRIVIALAAVFFVVLVSAKPAWSAWARLRARKIMAEGEAYLAQGRRAEALNAGRKVLRAGTEDARVHTLLLNTLGTENFREAFYFWTKLSSRAEISVEQRRALVRWAVAWGQPELAEPHWRVLFAERPAELETLRLGAALCEARGDLAAAVRYAQSVLRASPNDAETRLLLARVLVMNGAGRDREIGKRLLLEQARRPDATGLYALRLLSAENILNPFEATECLQWLNARDPRSPSDLLTSAALKIAITPYREAEIIAETLDAFAKRGGDFLQLALWFSKRQDWDALLASVPEAEAVKHAELLLVYLDALGATGKWNEIERILGRNSLPLDALSSAVFMARTASMQGEERTAKLRWAHALEVAGKESSALLKLADYARRSGAMEVAREACEKAIAQGGESAKRGYCELLRTCATDLVQAREVLRRFVAAFPDDLHAANDLAYAELFLGQAPESVLTKIEDAARAKPEYMGFQTTRALALLRRGNAAAAKQAFRIEPGRWVELLPNQQAVYAASVGAAGESEFAREICAGIDLEKLRREERELIRAWL